MFISKFRNRKGKLKEQKGTAAIEFSFLAFPLALLIFMTFEVAFLHWGNGLLDNVLLQTVKRTKTMCPNDNCDINPIEDVLKFIKEESAGFIDYEATNDGGGRNRLCLVVRSFGSNGLEDGDFNLGGPGDIVLYMASYDWPIYGPASLITDSLNGGDIEACNEESETYSESACASAKAALPQFFRFSSAVMVRNENSATLPSGGVRDSNLLKKDDALLGTVQGLNSNDDSSCGLSPVAGDLTSLNLISGY